MKVRQFWINEDALRHGNVGVTAYIEKERAGEGQIVHVREVLPNEPDIPEIISKLMHEKSVAFDEARKWIDMAQELERVLALSRDAYKNSLLELSAWMGIPEHKRLNAIKEHLQNVDFIIKPAIEKFRAANEE